MDAVINQLGALFPEFNNALGAGIFIFARMAGFIKFAPIFYKKEIPTVAKVPIALIFTIIIFGVINPGAVPAENSMLLSILLNFAVGAMLGYMGRLILVAVAAGADMINMQMGLSSAMVLDPSTRSQVSILGKCISVLALLIFMYLGGVYWLINAFIRSFEIFPVFAVSIPLEQLVNMDYLVKMTSNVLFMGLQIASPVLLATLGQDIILGIISKTAPQVNVFQLSFLFKPVLGAASLVWILPMLINVITDYFLSFSHII